MGRGAICPSSSCQTVVIQGRRPSGAEMLRSTTNRGPNGGWWRRAPGWVSPVLPQFTAQCLPVRRVEAEAGKEAGLARAEGVFRVEQVVHELFPLHDEMTGVGKIHG